jgi:hypothetical protein
LEEPKGLVSAGAARYSVSLTAEDGNAALAKGVVAFYYKESQFRACARGDGVSIYAALTVQPIRHQTRPWKTHVLVERQ